MNVLTDTNIILDAMMSRAPYDKAAQKLFLLAAQNKIRGYITANSVTDIYYILHKYLHDNNKCKQALIKLFMIFDVLDITGSDCKKALEFQMSDYEDALLAACAKRTKMDYIISRNLKDFVHSPVKTISPDDFIKDIKK